MFKKIKTFFGNVLGVLGALCLSFLYGGFIVYSFVFKRFKVGDLVEPGMYAECDGGTRKFIVIGKVKYIKNNNVWDENKYMPLMFTYEVLCIATNRKYQYLALEIRKIKNH